jgi:hypothetical protein
VNKLVIAASLTLALMGCVTTPQVSKEENCAAYAMGVVHGQGALNEGMTRLTFERKIKELQEELKDDPLLDPAIHGLRRGFNGIKESHPQIMGIKAFDDCIVSK